MTILNMKRGIPWGSEVRLIYRSSHGANWYLLSFSRTKHEGLHSGCQVKEVFQKHFGIAKPRMKDTKSVCCGITPIIPCGE